MGQHLTGKTAAVTGARATSVIPAWGDTGSSRAAGVPGHAPETLAQCIKA
jgi:hypothetical protein